MAAKYLAKESAARLGIIGCGWQAETQIAAVRAALPEFSSTVVFCRDSKRRGEFVLRMGAEPAESHQEAAAQDVVVTITTSNYPVLRGEWLRPGALVCAAGANVPSNRELDNAVSSGPRSSAATRWRTPSSSPGTSSSLSLRGVLDWLEVHELAEVVVGELPGRQADDDIVVFKSNGIAAWDVAVGAAAVTLAREQRIGLEL